MERAVDTMVVAGNKRFGTAIIGKVKYEKVKVAVAVGLIMLFNASR